MPLTAIVVSQVEERNKSSHEALIFGHFLKPMKILYGSFFEGKTTYLKHCLLDNTNDVSLAYRESL